MLPFANSTFFQFSRKAILANEKFIWRKFISILVTQFFLRPWSLSFDVQHLVFSEEKSFFSSLPLFLHHLLHLIHFVSHSSLPRCLPNPHCFRIILSFHLFNLTIFHDPVIRVCLFSLSLCWQLHQWCIFFSLSLSLFSSLSSSSFSSSYVVICKLHVETHANLLVNHYNDIIINCQIYLLFLKD